MTRRAAAAAAAVLAAASAALLAAPTAAGAAAPLGLQIAVSQISPAIPQPGDTLTFAGTVTNRTKASVHDLTQLLVFDPDRFLTRSDLDAYATGTGPLGLPPPGAYAQPLHSASLAPGASEPFKLTEPVDALGLSETQVGSYRIGVQIAGYTGAGALLSTTLRTFLPWWPMGVAGAPPRTPISWVWPVLSGPAAAGEAAPAALPGQLSPGGRLSAIVSAGAAAQSLAGSAGRPARAAAGKRKAQPAVLPTNPVPVDWVVDPMLTQYAQSLAGGSAGKGRPGVRADAGSWLTSLGAAVSGAPLIGLPYANPDLVAETDAGLIDEFTQARRLGASVLRSTLHASPLSGYYWPPGGALDQSAADELATLGYHGLVLSDSSLPPASQLFTHSALSRLPAGGARLTAFVSDGTLSQAVTAGAAAGPSGELLAAQRYLAETLFVDYEYPLVRALVVAPSPKWAPSEDYANLLLDDTAHAPWLSPESLPQLATDTKVDVASRAPLTYPAAERATELPAHYVASVAAAQHRLALLAELFSRPNNSVVSSLRQELLRSLSAEWRGDPAAGAALRRSVTSDVDGLLSGVQVFSAGTVTFTSHQGTVPLTIVNHLSQAVRVTVHLQAPAAQIQQTPGQITVAPGQAVQHEVALTLQAAGTFPLQVQLATPDGQVIGQPVQLLIHSTAYGALALGITGGALAVLLAAAAIRLLRRARAPSHGSHS